MRRAGIVLAAALGLMLVDPGPSKAYLIGGPPWPDALVTYSSARGDGASSVDRAARIWNRAGEGVRLRRTSSVLADVVVNFRGRGCDGHATVGFNGDGRSWVSLGSRCNDAMTTLTAVHEFGHVLGLAHERRRCSTMNPTFDLSGTPSRCRARPLAYWVRSPLRADDRWGLHVLYGHLK